MNAAEFLTPSQTAATFLEAALRRDKHSPKMTSLLVQGKTPWGSVANFRVWRVVSPVSVEIMRNYFEACSNNFPVTFASSRGVIQETTLAATDSTRVSNV